MQVRPRPALHRLAHPAVPAVCGGILFQPGKTGRRTKRPFPPDPINGMSVHHHLAYETVGYAPVYVTRLCVGVEEMGNSRSRSKCPCCSCRVKHAIVGMAKVGPDVDARFVACDGSG